MLLTFSVSKCLNCQTCWCLWLFAARLTCLRCWLTIMYLFLSSFSLNHYSYFLDLSHPLYHIFYLLQQLCYQHIQKAGPGYMLSLSAKKSQLLYHFFHSHIKNINDTTSLCFNPTMIKGLSSQSSLILCLLGHKTELFHGNILGRIAND